MRNVANLAKFSGFAMCCAVYAVVIIAVDTPAFKSNPDDGVDRTITFANRNVFPGLQFF